MTKENISENCPVCDSNDKKLMGIDGLILYYRCSRCSNTFCVDAHYLMDDNENEKKENINQETDHTE